MKASVAQIVHHLPDRRLTNDDLAAEFGDWDSAKILEKTGIRARAVAAPEECASDLGVRAAEALFASGSVRREQIDFLLLCTQSPDYFLPTTACLMQDRLRLPTTCGALDFNLGCSGYVYGLSLAKGLIESGQCRNVLLVTSETYTKNIHPKDRSVRTLFGDGAAATWIRGVESSEDLLGPFVLGTDGSGGNNLIVPSGGMRTPRSAQTAVEYENNGSVRSQDHLYMNGPEIFSFTIWTVPRVVRELLEKACLTLEAVDLFCFHQANKFMLEHLRRALHIPEDRFLLEFETVGNTVSSTIPIALACAGQRGRIRPGMRIAAVGFGVGYSWGATILRVPDGLWGAQAIPAMEDKK
jgi:3-oxoacyl-[acyl-carrier-protein] synthase III